MHYGLLMLLTFIIIWVFKPFSEGVKEGRDKTQETNEYAEQDPDFLPPTAAKEAGRVVGGLSSNIKEYPSLITISVIILLILLFPPLGIIILGALLYQWCSQKPKKRKSQA
jgi:hypothetical protein